MTEQQFDVFLCHNSEDKPAVIEIAQQLQQKSLRPWLDVWSLQPGAIWQFALEQQIENIGAAAVFVGQQGLGPWQSEEIYAFLQEFIRRKCPVIPVMLHDAPQQPKLPVFLRNRHWVDYRLRTPDPTVQLIWGITGQRPNDVLGTAEVIQTRAVASEIQPSTKAAAELAAVRQELERLKAQQSAVEAPLPKAAAPDDLSSEKGIDYTRLRNLLRERKWRDADQETYEVMSRAVGKKPGKWFTSDELRNFPCADLKTIDGLWTKYSNGHFGFSVQKNIWQERGSPTSPGKKWDQFCIDVGWQSVNLRRYNRDYELRADPRFSPLGEFPAHALWWWSWKVMVGVGGVKVPFEFFSRIQTCRV